MKHKRIWTHQNAAPREEPCTAPGIGRGEGQTGQRFDAKVNRPVSRRDSANAQQVAQEARVTQEGTAMRCRSLHWAYIPRRIDEVISVEYRRTETTHLFPPGCTSTVGRTYHGG